MLVFRCIVSGFFAIGGVVFLFDGMFDSSLLLWFVAAAVLPYEAAKNIVSPFAILLGVFGIVRLLYFDFYKAFLCIGIGLIIGIKLIRLNKEVKCLRRFYSGYSSGSGTYSSDSSYDYAKRQQEDEEERQRRFNERERAYEEEREREYEEELEEQRRREQAAYEAECRRRETEELSQRKYGCSADIASNWDEDIRDRL